MLPPIGAQIMGLPVRLEFVRDLEVFEGPLLSERKNGNGAAYLEKLCTCDETTRRTLIVRSDHRSIAEYLGGRLSMRHLFLDRSDGVGFLCDYARGGFQRTSLVELSALPEKYLPTIRAFHDPTLRPRWTRVPQEFLVDEEWDAQVLRDVEKVYLEVHAFTFAANHQPDLIRTDLARLRFDSGFTYRTAFNELRKKVPHKERARTVGVHAASPGVLSMDAPRGIAEEITRALIRVRDKQTIKAYHILHAWSTYDTDKSDEVPATAEADIERLCSALGISSSAVLRPLDDMMATPKTPESATGNTAKNPRKRDLLQAGKMIAMYYRRLGKLLNPSYGVEFILDKSLTDQDGPEDDESFEEDDEFEDAEDFEDEDEL